MIEMPNKMVYVDGYAVRYLDINDSNNSEGKETLLLLHGIGASAERWLHVVPLLKKYFRIIVPDIVGFGYSDKPTVEYSINFFVNFVSNFLSLTNAKRTHIIGSSFGGLVAAEFALKFESVVNKLVLVSPAGSMKTSTKTLDEYILAALYPTNENARRAFFDMAYDPQTVTEDTIKDFVNRMKLPNAKYAFMSTLLGIRNIEDLADRLKGIMSPTLLVWGEEDRMIPPSYADEYRKIPNSKLTVIPNSGHTPFTETPRSFANIVLNFIGPFNNIK